MKNFHSSWYINKGRERGGVQLHTTKWANYQPLVLKEWQQRQSIIQKFEIITLAFL